MPPITTDTPRKIVEDFAKLIRQKQSLGPKPTKEVIYFRNDKLDGIERDVVSVPISLLRYRKDNGRIASDVLNYEKTNGPLNENDSKAQELLGKFLTEKDPEKTEILTRSIAHQGQNEAAIITCDGFLINGNRRKMVLEKLHQDYPGQAEYERMKAVILPGPDDPTGPPTLLEIERLENRYQLQSEGKSEYYGFDRALSIKRKIELGFTLKEQLSDDPRYVKADDKEINQAIKEVEKEYLGPLACVDRYLQLFNREGLYGTVSLGRSDKEGRWQAFIDYSNVYQQKFQNEKWLLDNGIDADDIGGIENAAFKMIRLRDVKVAKIHMVMRQLPKLCAVKESLKHLLKICEEVDDTLPKKECFDEKGNPLSVEQADRKWAALYQEDIIHRLVKARETQENNQDQVTPIALLEAALQKLMHEDMEVSQMGVVNFSRGRKLAADIQKRAKEIESDIYHAEKDLRELPNKK